MTAQLSAAAAFNGRHDFQLRQTDMPSALFPPRTATGAEDIRDFQWLRQGRALGRWLEVQMIQRALGVAQHAGGHLAIQGRGLKLLVAE